MSKKIKAFTIMEVTIAMLVAAIAIAITYTCFTIISKSYLSFKNRQQQLVEVSQLTRLLTSDLDKAKMINAVNGGITLINDTSQTLYKFDPAYILRMASSVDTFKVNSKVFSISFEGQPVVASESIGEQSRADEISFIIISGQDEFPYHYYKLYSAQNLINRNPHAEH